MKTWQHETKFWGLLLGTNPEIETPVMQQFNSGVYGIHQAKTVESAEKLISVNYYDFVLCFESFAQDAGGDFIGLISREPYHKKVIALIDQGGRSNFTKKFSASAWAVFQFHSDIGISLHTDLVLVRLLVEKLLSHYVPAKPQKR